MTSQSSDDLSPEKRLLKAFDRLRDGVPMILKVGTPVSQNNVTLEAGYKDPSALRKKRFPDVVRKIQDYLDIQPKPQTSARDGAKATRASKRSLIERLNDAEKQRDMAQSIIASAERRIVGLVAEVESLRLELDDLKPPPHRLGQR